MSETINPPEYYFPNIDFNPAFYENNLSAEDEALLNARYVQFPVAQNVPITFTAIVRGLTAGTTENSTIIATTEWIQNFYNYVKTIANTWSGLQTFTLGMKSNTINPTATSTPDPNTLYIGNEAVSTNVEIATQTGRTSVLHLGDGNNSTGGIHIGNGTNSSNNVNILNGAGSTGTINLGRSTTPISLGAPMTPNYLYPVASGKIGQIIDITVFTAITWTSLVPAQVSTLTGLAVGTWILSGSVNRGNTGNGVPLFVAISTVTADVTSANCLGIEYCVGAGLGLTNTVTAIVQSTGTSTVYYLNAMTSTGGSGTQFIPFYYRAVRIA